jgi:hypothetical protein
LRSYTEHVERHLVPYPGSIRLGELTGRRERIRGRVGEHVRVHPAPGLLIGALLGWAEYLRRTGGRPRWRLLVLSPLLFAAILVRGLIEDPTTMFEGGIGAGTIAIPVLSIIGGHALSGRGSPWTRLPAGVVGVATLAVWPLTGTAVGGPSFALDTPHGLWAAVLYDALLVLFALAASIPQREPVRVPTVPVPAVTATQKADMVTQ